MPQNLVDIHAHLLPGIDDGPDTLEESLDMARAAVSTGIGTIATTPHLRSDFPDVLVEEIGPRCAEVQRALDSEGIPLRVLAGAEISLLWALEASDEQLMLASYAQRGTDLLIETPSDALMLDRMLYAVRTKGFRITLGHPERSIQFQGDPEPLARLVEQGVLLQVNAGSLLHRRSPPGRLAERLCRDGLAHVVASDGHRGQRWRPVTALADAVRAVAGLFGQERAEWLASASPGAITQGEEIPVAPEILEQPRRRRLFGPADRGR
ncbi:MAG: tyrosine-protein phosphatase [Solirubrobacteraceae bacterium]